MRAPAATVGNWRTKPVLAGFFANVGTGVTTTNIISHYCRRPHGDSAHNIDLEMFTAKTLSPALDPRTARILI